MSINQTSDKCPLNPLSCLTANSNVAIPLLLSYHQSIAHAQAQKAHAAKEAGEVAPAPSMNPTSLKLVGPSLSLTPTSTSPATSPATSQPRSMPLTSALPSESEDESNTQSTMAANRGQKKRKWHDTTGENFGIDRLIGIESLITSRSRGNCFNG